jgi:predicted RNA-binding protein YlqC (UPF0109 family)
MNDFSELVHYMASQLADHPESVEVRVRSGTPAVYEIHVAPEDQGRMIGKDGRTIQAMRTLVAAAARKTGQRATVELAEE